MFFLAVNKKKKKGWGLLNSGSQQIHGTSYVQPDEDTAYMYFTVPLTLQCKKQVLATLVVQLSMSLTATFHFAVLT